MLKNCCLVVGELNRLLEVQVKYQKEASHVNGCFILGQSRTQVASLFRVFLCGELHTPIMLLGI